MNPILKKTIYWLIPILIIALLAWPKIKENTQKQEQAGTTAVQRLLPVNILPIQARILENRFRTTGTLLANEEVDLRAEISGKITKLNFDEGSEVKRGALLVKIFDADLQADLTRVNYQIKLAEDIEFRQRKLLERGGISQQEYDRALNELNVLKAQRTFIEAQIQRTEIRAPFDGRIGLKFVSEGSYITPTSAIASLQSIDPIKVEFAVPERYLSEVNVGDRIQFKVAGFRDAFEGTLYAIEPRISTETRTVSIRALASNKNMKLLPGAFAEIDYIFQEIPDALLIPSQALVPELKGQKVFVYKAGVVGEKPVEIGIRTEREVQIVQGLAVGDTVITSGILQVRPGMSVEGRIPKP